MTPFFQKLLAMIALAIAIGVLAPWLSSAAHTEPSEWMLALCGLLIGVFIAKRRLSEVNAPV